jgi:hypothetical protein
MYALTHRNGNSFEILAVAKEKMPLREIMKDEVLVFVEETYSDDEEVFEWLMPISDTMDFWGDEDEFNPVSWKITEVKEISAAHD